MKWVPRRKIAIVSIASAMLDLLTSFRAAMGLLSAAGNSLAISNQLDERPNRPKYHYNFAGSPEIEATGANVTTFEGLKARGDSLLHFSRREQL